MADDVAKRPVDGMFNKIHVLYRYTMWILLIISIAVSVHSNSVSSLWYQL